MFRDLLKSVALRVPPIRELKTQRDALSAEVANYADVAFSAAYEVLEGTPHSRYALPVDYKPSRDFRPRWGYSRPRIQILDDWFRSYEAEYHEFLSLMRKRAPRLSRIPLEFSEANLPSRLGQARPIVRSTRLRSIRSCSRANPGATSKSVQELARALPARLLSTANPRRR